MSLFAFTDSNNQTDFSNWTYSTLFDGAPGTSAYAAARGGSNDEMHIVVIDEDGLFTGTPGTVLERFAFVSQATDALNEDGSTNYFVNIINNQSNYIWFGNHDTTNFPEAGSTAAGNDFATIDSNGVITTSLSGGADSAALTATEFANGWDLFNDSTEEASLFIAPDLPSGSETTIANDIISIAVSRTDAIVFISPERTDLTAAAIKSMADAITATSYAVIDSGRFQVYDKYNDAFINIPACSSTAGLVAATEEDFGAWFSPAGYRRGQYLGVTRLLFNPTQSDRDTLYKAGINPIISKPSRGIVLFGDKTHLNRPSAFDRINVRRLFITLRTSIGAAAEDSLFEFNDEFTRAQFLNIVEPYLRDVQGRRGITAFRVVCDTTNNTPSVIARNEFVGDIYIRPNYSINFIQLNFIATRDDVRFNEITG